MFDAFGCCSMRGDHNDNDDMSVILGGRRSSVQPFQDAGRRSRSSKTRGGKSPRGTSKSPDHNSVLLQIIDGGDDFPVPGSVVGGGGGTRDGDTGPACCAGGRTGGGDAVDDFFESQRGDHARFGSSADIYERQRAAATGGPPMGRLGSPRGSKKLGQGAFDGGARVRKHQVSVRNLTRNGVHNLAGRGSTTE